MLDNARHERFAQGLVEGLSQVEAYARAGFERDTGAASRLSANVSVVARVQELQNEAAEAAVLTKTWVLIRLMRNVDRAMQAQPVLDRKGEPTGEYEYDGTAANKALELLGKEQGMFVDRSENTTVIKDVSDVPVDRDGTAWIAQFGTPH